MKDSYVVHLVSYVALLVAVMGLLSFGSGRMDFAAGAEGCVFKTTPNYCDGVNGEDCKAGGNKCADGTAYNSCKDGEGGDASGQCTSRWWCSTPSGGISYAKTNSTGC